MESTNEDPAVQKNMHGCLTAWLLLLLLGNLFLTLVYLVGGDMRPFLVPEESHYFIFILFAILGIANVYFTLLLFQWKKWGFWGYIITTIVTLILNISLGMPLGQALAGLFGLAILYIMLQTSKGDLSAWEHLE